MSTALAPPAVVALDAALDQLAALPADWDGHAGRPVDRATLSAARTWVRRMPDWAITPPPHVVPLSSGAVQFEWHAGPRVLEVEFETADRIHFLRWDPSAAVEDEDVFPADDFARSEELIRWAKGDAGRG